MSTEHIYDVVLVTTEHWSGTVTAIDAEEAQEAAERAYNADELRQEHVSVTRIDVHRRPSQSKRFTVGYVIETGYEVELEAQSQADAESRVVEHIMATGEPVAGSRHEHYSGQVAFSEEVQP